MIRNQYIKEWQDEMMNRAIKNFNADGALYPVCLLLLSDYNIDTLDMNFETDKDKDLFFNDTLPETCKASGVVALLFLGEAWVLNFQLKDQNRYIKNGKYIAPGKHEEKKECLVATLETKEGTRNIMYGINRTAPTPTLTIPKLEESDEAQHKDLLIHPVNIN